jgi:hypothetical protein
MPYFPMYSTCTFAMNYYITVSTVTLTKGISTRSPLLILYRLRGDISHERFFDRFLRSAANISLACLYPPHALTFSNSAGSTFYFLILYC